MRVAFILGAFPAVSKTFIINQITGLMDRGHLVFVFATKRGRKELFSEDVDRYNLINITRYTPNIPKSRIVRILAALKLILKYLKQKPFVLLCCLYIFKYRDDIPDFNLVYRAIPFLKNGSYDIIHCQFGTHGLKAVRLRELGFIRGKVITSFRGRDLSRYLRIKGNRVYTELFAKGDLFLPVSDYFKDKLIELGCNEKKILVHRSGIDCSKFNYFERKPIDDGSIQLLSIGRLVEKKGFEFSIKAVAQVIMKNKYKLKYTIIGDGPMMDYLSSLIIELKANNSIVLLGARSHEEVIKSLYKSHVFIAPSFTAADGDQEGIPNVLKEAMATGMPVISTHHSGIPELVKDGSSGFLVPERNIDGLCEKILYLSEHPSVWPEMGKKGRNMVKEYYDINKLNDELVNIYHDMQFRKQ